MAETRMSTCNKHNTLGKTSQKVRAHNKLNKVCGRQRFDPVEYSQGDSASPIKIKPDWNMMQANFAQSKIMCFLEKAVSK